MFIAPYWARARLDEEGAPADGPAVAFGWSFVSQEEAAQHAHARAGRVAERLRFLRDLPREKWDTASAMERWWALTPDGVQEQVDWVGDFPWDYYGGSRPVREPILETYGASESPWALITRNRYGARVLNTAGAMFVDIDQPLPGYDARTFWERWILRVPPPRAPEIGELEERARSVVAANPGMGMRLYRTKNGLRGLVTHRPYTPGSDEAEAVLEAFGSDPLYRQLCQAQRCFRARLTPKPWRLDMAAPPINWFPYQQAPERVAVWEAWLRAYEAHSVGHTACTFVEHMGEPEVHPEIATVVELHDAEALGEGPLA